MTGVASAIFMLQTVLCLYKGYEGRLKILSINGVAPSVEAVLSGRYPYRRPVSLVFRKQNPKKRSIDRLTRFLRDASVDFFKGALLTNHQQTGGE